jgi:hypothetical protein
MRACPRPCPLTSLQVEMKLTGRAACKSMNHAQKYLVHANRHIAELTVQIAHQRAIIKGVLATGQRSAISARAPRHLSGLADAKVEQHCHRYGHYDEH